MYINSFEEAESFLYDQIQNKEERLPYGKHSNDKIKYLLKLLDNPQDKIQIIHIAGTSGKGSTSYLINLLISSTGAKVGLHTSPHLFDIRERFVINNDLISKDKFIFYINELLPFIESTNKVFDKNLNYFEILVALAYHIFYKEKVQYGVIETGMGGLKDATNIVSSKSKIAVITKIGLNHKKHLGNTISEIASHKAGIIMPFNKVIALFQKDIINNIFLNKSKEVNADIALLSANMNFKNVIATSKITEFDFSFKDASDHIELSLLGDYQAENCALALAVCYSLGLYHKLDLSILKSARFRGRFECFNIMNRKVILDAAHNDQKIENLIKNLKLIFPNKKFDILMAYKGSTLKVVSKYSDLIENLIITNYFDDEFKMEKFETKRVHIENILKLGNITNYSLISNYNIAFKELEKKSDTILVITGSIYFIGKAYKLFNLYERNTDRF